MSHAHPSSSKSSNSSKHSAHRVDGSHRDGLTGMGPATKMHFADVQAKMFDYIGEEVPWEEELDQSRRNHHHKHQPQHRLHVPPAVPSPHHNFVDGAKHSKSIKKTPSPNTAQKHHTHTGSTKKKESSHH